MAVLPVFCFDILSNLCINLTINSLNTGCFWDIITMKKCTAEALRILSAEEDRKVRSNPKESFCTVIIYTQQSAKVISRQFFRRLRE